MGEDVGGADDRDVVAVEELVERLVVPAAGAVGARALDAVGAVEVVLGDVAAAEPRGGDSEGALEDGQRVVGAAAAVAAHLLRVPPAVARCVDADGELVVGLDDQRRAVELAALGLEHGPRRRRLVDQDEPAQLVVQLAVLDGGADAAALQHAVAVVGVPVLAAEAVVLARDASAVQLHVQGLRQADLLSCLLRRSSGCW